MLIYVRVDVALDCCVVCRDSLKPAKTFYIGLDGQRVDNYIGGIATDGAGMMP
jgi:hypothetical protein